MRIKKSRHLIRENPCRFVLIRVQEALPMNRIDTRFAELQSAGRKALVPFVTAGDPSLEATVPVMHALVDAGADLVELGVPFSDPMADGPVIQRSSERALARGAGLDYVLGCLRAFRERDATTPVVLMGYLNPVEVRGAQHYARAAAGAGVDGVLLVDLPPEEGGAFETAFAAHGLFPIRLLAPTTPPDRVERVLAGARGYLYYVSFAGVTGADALDPAAAGARIAALRGRSAVPVLAGFGIKDAASAAGMAVQADGVVVGSALVAMLAAAADPVRAAGGFLSPLRAAVDAAWPAQPLR
jgi:tryptophan synthase alpha chain